MFACCLRPYLFAACLLSTSASCGREPLPAFANPPPDHTGDAGERDIDAEADDADAGTDSNVR